MEQSTLLNVGLWSGREKKKREIGMARKRAENRERSLGFPGFVKPVFTKDSKPLGRRKISLGHLGSVKPVSLPCNTKTVGKGPDSEPRSSDEGSTGAGNHPFPIIHNTPVGGLRAVTDLGCVTR
ncbi:hypothetical protein TNCV_2260111 [Trichonephila clavipes]|nr:hypothetical protein TNCV_2260111 [Trichonephila clavipes]